MAQHGTIHHTRMWMHEVMCRADLKFPQSLVRRMKQGRELRPPEWMLIQVSHPTEATPDSAYKATSNTYAQSCEKELCACGAPKAGAGKMQETEKPVVSDGWYSAWISLLAHIMLLEGMHLHCRLQSTIS